MGLANLYNTPATEEEFMSFSFSNMDHHRLIASAISAQKGIELSLAPLDPVPMFDFPGWAKMHQQMHADFTNALGINGSDLTDVNWQDPAQLAAWMRLHADEHRQADDALRIGR